MIKYSEMMGEHAYIPYIELLIEQSVKNLQNREVF